MAKVTSGLLFATRSSLMTVPDSSSESQLVTLGKRSCDMLLQMDFFRGKAKAKAK